MYHLFKLSIITILFSVLSIPCALKTVIASTPTTATSAAAAGGSGGGMKLCADQPFGVPRFSSSPTSSSEASTVGNKKKVTSTSPTAAGTAFLLRGGEVHEVKTLSETEEIIEKAKVQQKLVVIDFTAAWCGPCKMIAPIYNELSESEEVKAKGVVFLKVDVDENADTAQKYSISAMPTFMFIKDGEVIDRLMGANHAKLKEMVMNHA